MAQAQEMARKQQSKTESNNPKHSSSWHTCRSKKENAQDMAHKQQWHQQSRRNIFLSNLPATVDGFVSNHVMVNMIRADLEKRPLARSRELDEMAKHHAKKMARLEEVVHSVRSLNELGARLGTKHAGENVMRGPSIQLMQDAVKFSDSMWGNIVNDTFMEFGMGTFKGNDGKLYMCQLFR